MNVDVEFEEASTPVEVWGLETCGHVQMVRHFSSSLCSRRRDVCGRHGVHCNIFLGDDFHPSRCTTPSENNHMAGSAGEPIGHSMCTSDAWRHRDSTEYEPLRLVLVRSCWTHNEHWIQQGAMETHFKYCDHQYVSSGCVRRSAFPGPGVCSQANALHGWPCPFDWYCDDEISCGPG